MRNIPYVSFFCLILTLASCEEVIDLNLQSAEPRLVIEASVNWVKGTDGNAQVIKLSITAPYFDKTIPPATGAKVIVTDTKNNLFEFLDDSNIGIYRNVNFKPEIGMTYNLEITYNNEVYIATETLKSVVPIDFVEQQNNVGFPSNETEIKAFYSDPKGVENRYLFEFVNPATNKINLEVYNDEFIDGNQIFGVYFDDDLSPGDTLIIRNYGISERYYEYMNILLQQTDDQAGDPFETQPATVRGNCINQTNPDNFPLGYFRLSEADQFIYTIE